MVNLLNLFLSVYKIMSKGVSSINIKLNMIFFKYYFLFLSIFIIFYYIVLNLIINPYNIFVFAEPHPTDIFMVTYSEKIKEAFPTYKNNYLWVKSFIPNSLTSDQHVINLFMKKLSSQISKNLSNNHIMSSTTLADLHKLNLYLPQRQRLVSFIVTTPDLSIFDNKTYYYIARMVYCQELYDIRMFALKYNNTPYLFTASPYDSPLREHISAFSHLKPKPWFYLDVPTNLSLFQDALMQLYTNPVLSSFDKECIKHLYASYVIFASKHHSPFMNAQAIQSTYDAGYSIFR